ncbi:MAG: phosphoenolpyruvate synthase [Candidatus Woesearchaeota archaeon]
MDKSNEFILWFDQLDINDVGLVGGKNASLGEMYVNLSTKNISVPNGFALTAYAYRYIVDKLNLRTRLEEMLQGLNTHDMHDLSERGEKIRAMFRNIDIPEEILSALSKAYKDLSSAYNMDEADVAVRSSATAEDLPDASFAGQQETYLNVKGLDELVLAVKKCIASLFTNRAISYRVDKGYDHFSIALSVGVQKMVRSDKGSSGVMFTLDTESGFKDVILINAAYGLGENVVQGAVNPDEYFVFKGTVFSHKPIVQKRLGEKEIKMIYSKEGNKPVKNVNVPHDERLRFALSDDDIMVLARWGTLIEAHYSEKAGYYKPMDIEWAKDGITGELFIVQARPETVVSQKSQNVLETYVLEEHGKEIVRGQSVGDRIGQGQVNVIKDVHNIHEFKKGQVLVTDMTDPDWEPIMKIASGIITNRGGRTCHAAIVSRELGIPAIVGTNDATTRINNNQEVTVVCSEGDEGIVYDGKLKFRKDVLNLDSIPTPKTKIKMIVGSPDQAFKFSMIPNDGVGLAREEFIIMSYIKVHPLALLHFDKVTDNNVRSQIEDLTAAYLSKEQFFIDKLAEGIGMIGAAFYPKDVIVRLSDFKSNEYANLVGGKYFEPREDNPMIGWRGASRYYSEKYKDAFALECKALLKVRDDYGLSNVHVMIPFCRTVEEGKKVIAEMTKNNLVQGKDGMRVYVMAEIPSNVILADEFSQVFDGFSIGSNDLTQLILGLDRDSELVAHIYDERNMAVKTMISDVIMKAKNNSREIGICGQGPSDFPDFAQFLVEKEIDSISLNPDTVIKTRILIYDKEKELGWHG